MLDQETDRIISTIQQRTIGVNQTVVVKDILAAEIPSPIKVFFRADVELMLLNELRDHRKTSRFEFNRPDVQSLQQQANSILLLHFTFDRTEYLRRLEDVVHMTANFLIRPQWTMKNVLFENDDTVGTPSLLRLLRYFGSYGYLRDMIVRYVQEKNISSFRRDDFSSFLWRADGEYVRRKTGDELARQLTPMFQFFEYPGPSGHYAIPAAALIKYFEDKGLSPVIIRLEGEAAQNKLAFSQVELGLLLEAVRSSTGAFAVDRPDHALNPPPPPVAHAATSSGGGVATLSPLANLITSIEESDRKKFAKKIFRQDESSLATALDVMTGIATWKEASKYIDEIFIRNNIDPYSSEAVKFTEVVFQRFHPRSS